MARVTVTVEGDVEEVRAALVALLGSEELGGSSEELGQGRAIVGGQGATRSPWTPGELARLWDYLTPNAQRVLATVARRPEGYAHEDLVRDLDSDMRSIGGNLSSVGHAMRRLFRSGDTYLKPRPIENDYAWRRYRMDEDVAEMVRGLSPETTEDD